MSYYQLSDHFKAFFGRLNPSPTFETQASREYNTIKSLIENSSGPARGLSPQCFLQGSYRQNTAIYTINDIDVVALCELWQPGIGGDGGGPTYNRDDIFRIIAAPLLQDARYRHKVHFGPTSMCIKVDLDIKVEILPVVFRAGNSDPVNEPFRLWRPERQQWEDGYARLRQGYLSVKNDDTRTEGNFIAAIKVFKHIRSLFGRDAVSFHIECLLHSFPDSLFRGAPADYLAKVLQHIAAKDAVTWWGGACRTPCGERDIFMGDEWNLASWQRFHEIVANLAILANAANTTTNRATAIDYWQTVLGKDYFPASVT